jgi:hypothetical protein
MITLKKIYELFKSESYDEAIREINTALSLDDSIAYLYFYRFLAFNQDYSHMDFSDCQDEIDLNKAIDYEEEYSYLAEFNLIKRLEGAYRKIFIAIVREDGKEINRLMKNIEDHIEDVDVPYFEEFISNLDDKQLKLLAKVFKACFMESMKKLSSDVLSTIANVDLPMVEEREENLIIIGNSLVGVKGEPIYVKVPDYVKSISGGAFKNITSLKKIVLSENVESIGDEAFYGCFNCYCFKLNKKLKKIGARAFGYCKRLRAISIPRNIHTLGDEAFMYCNKLKQIKLPRNITNLGDAIFSGCSSLRALATPLNSKKIGAFFGKHPYEKSYAADQSSLESNKEEKYYIPNALEKVQVSFYSLIPDCTFKNATSLKRIVFGVGHSIGKGAFMNCTSLEELTFDGVSFIQAYACSGCTNLKKVSITGLNFPIGEYAFRDCTSLNEIDMSYSVNAFGEGCFMNCSSLKSFIVPKNIKKLPHSIFLGCSNLEDVKIEGSLEAIESYAFQDCIALTRIELPEARYGLATISSYAFLNCTSLLEAKIASSYTYIEKGIFSGCSSLRRITIPASYSDGMKYFVNYFGTHEFENSLAIPKNDKKQKTIYYIPKSLAEVELLGGSVPVEYFMDLSKLKKVKLRDATLICFRAFAGCKELNEVILSKDLKTITSLAFSDCPSLYEIWIPKGVKRIGFHAFTGPKLIHMKRKKPLFFKKPFGFQKEWYSSPKTKIEWEK